MLALPAGAGARDIFVNTTADGIANNGDCTLREAIRAANTNAAVDGCAAGQPAPAIDVVVLSEAVAPYRLTVAGADDATGDLDVYSSLDITGAPSTIDASGLGDRVLDLRSGAVVRLVMVHLRGGNAGVFSGGGAYAGAGSSLMLFRSSVRGNYAGSGAGLAATAGAIVTLHDSDVSSNGAASGIAASSATVTLIDSTVADNQGVGVAAASSVVTVLQSTISGNTASGMYASGTSTLVVRNATLSGNGGLDLARGGGLLIDAPAVASLYYSTVADNDAMTGGGVSVTGTLTMKGTILGANRATISNPDCYSGSAIMTTQGYNLIQREDCGFVPIATDRVGVDPRLDALADWGGPTRTHRLLPGSPALDNGDAPDFPAFDQRGEARPRNGDLDAVSRADLGAHENGNTITVDLGADIASADGKCGLREAIRAANGDIAVDGCRAGVERDLIWIDPAAVGNLSLSLLGIDDLAAVGDLDVRSDLDLAGLPGRPAIIDGGSLERMFEVHAPGRLRLSHAALTRSAVFAVGGAGLRVAADAAASLFDVEIEGQSNAGENGGAALVEGELSGEAVWFHDNATDRDGGAIAVDGAAARLDLVRARVTDNLSTVGNGGGIAVIEGAARLADSTVAENRAGDDGGGIYNLARLELANATVVLNRADFDGVGGGSGGGIGAPGGATRLWNSLIADNLATTGPDCDGTLLSNGYNLLGDVDCSFAAAAGDRLDVDALLAPPFAAFYPTQTGSPARDAGSPDLTGSLGVSCSRRDGLGLVRPTDGGSGIARCDIGAIESVGLALLDVDGDGLTLPLTDGMLILRFLFGFTDSVLIDGAIGSAATRDTASAVIAYLTTVRSALDVDGDGVAQAMTDGMQILRYLFGLSGL